MDIIVPVRIFLNLLKGIDFLAHQITLKRFVFNRCLFVGMSLDMMVECVYKARN